MRYRKLPPAFPRFSPAPRHSRPSALASTKLVLRARPDNKISSFTMRGLVLLLLVASGPAHGEDCNDAEVDAAVAKVRAAHHIMFIFCIHSLVMKIIPLSFLCLRGSTTKHPKSYGWRSRVPVEALSNVPRPPDHDLSFPYITDMTTIHISILKFSACRGGTQKTAFSVADLPATVCKTQRARRGASGHATPEYMLHCASRTTHPKETRKRPRNQLLRTVKPKHSVILPQRYQRRACQRQYQRQRLRAPCRRRTPCLKRLVIYAQSFFSHYRRSYVLYILVAVAHAVAYREHASLLRPSAGVRATPPPPVPRARGLARAFNVLMMNNYIPPP